MNERVRERRCANDDDDDTIERDVSGARLRVMVTTRDPRGKIACVDATTSDDRF